MLIFFSFSVHEIFVCAWLYSAPFGCISDKQLNFLFACQSISHGQLERMRKSNRNDIVLSLIYACIRHQKRLLLFILSAFLIVIWFQLNPIFHFSSFENFFLIDMVERFAKSLLLFFF